MNSSLKYKQYIESNVIREQIPEDSSYIHTETLKVITDNIIFKDLDDKNKWVLVKNDSVNDYIQNVKKLRKDAKLKQIKELRESKTQKTTESTTQTNPETKTE